MIRQDLRGFGASVKDVKDAPTGVPSEPETDPVAPRGAWYQPTGSAARSPASSDQRPAVGGVGTVGLLVGLMLAYKFLR